jgi:glutathione S-transferase
LQQENNIFEQPPQDGGDQQSTGHLPTRIVPDPPNLQEWREKLFNVDDIIALSEEE